MGLMPKQLAPAVLVNLNSMSHAASGFWHSLISAARRPCRTDCGYARGSVGEPLPIERGRDVDEGPVIPAADANFRL
jgi:hypothetical protein